MSAKIVAAMIWIVSAALVASMFALPDAPASDWDWVRQLTELPGLLWAGAL